MVTLVTHPLVLAALVAHPLVLAALVAAIHVFRSRDDAERRDEAAMTSECLTRGTPIMGTGDFGVSEWRPAHDWPFAPADGTATVDVSIRPGLRDGSRQRSRGQPLSGRTIAKHP